MGSDICELLALSLLPRVSEKYHATCKIRGMYIKRTDCTVDKRISLMDVFTH